MGIQENLTLFRDMIGCCHNLYLWTYDRDFHLVSSNCPEQNAIDDLFALSRCKERELTSYSTPVIFTNEFGLVWIVACQLSEDGLTHLHGLGPFFVDDVPIKHLEAQLSRQNLSLSLRQKFMDFLHKLSVINLTRALEYAIMLHFCITGEKITVSDLRYCESERHGTARAAQQKLTDVHGTYKAEQEMLRMVREGDLNYQTHMDKLAITGQIGKLSNSDPMRQMKNMSLVGITLFSRAAIDGGLSPEISYTLTDHYFQGVEACTTISELTEINHTMQEDFIQRVHRCRTSHLSPPIRACCEYIEMHLEDKFTLKELAQQAGYSECYLSKKFKKEVKMSPGEYIGNQRLKRAAFLLRTTQSDVQDISEQLHFCSQSYFSERFRGLFGITPTQYRQQKEQMC